MSQQPVHVEDLTLYAMGLLDESETMRLQEALAVSPELREELAASRGDLALLALSVPQEEPTAAARQRLLAEIKRDPKRSAETASALGQIPSAAPTAKQRTSAPPEEIAISSLPTSRPEGLHEQPSRPRWFSSVLPWAGWAVAATLAVGSFSLYREMDSLHERLSEQLAANRQAVARATRAQAVLDTLRSTEAQRFVLTKADAQPVAQARVTYLARTGALVFQGSHLDPIPAAKTYELWLIPAAPGGQPIAAGTFKPDARGEASVILPELPKGVEAGKFGVTLEDEGGAATPTAPILLIGQ